MRSAPRSATPIKVTLPHCFGSPSPPPPRRTATLPPGRECGGRPPAAPRGGAREAAPAPRAAPPAPRPPSPCVLGGLPFPRHDFRTIRTCIARMPQRAWDACATVLLRHAYTGVTHGAVVNG